MKKIFEQLALEVGGSHYPSVGGDLLEKFGQAVIRECIKAVDQTDTRHAYTSFDHDQIRSTINKSKESIIRHFSD